MTTIRELKAATATKVSETPNLPELRVRAVSRLQLSFSAAHECSTIRPARGKSGAPRLLSPSEVVPNRSWFRSVAASAVGILAGAWYRQVLLLVFVIWKAIHLQITAPQHVSTPWFVH